MSKKRKPNQSKRINKYLRTLSSSPGELRPAVEQPDQLTQARALKDRLRLDWLSWAVLAIAAGVLCLQVLVHPIIGLADNGDFIKVMGPVGLKHHTAKPEDNFWYHPNTKFQFTEAGHQDIDYMTSERPLAHFARWIGTLASRDSLFDLRLLGSIHALLLLGGIALLLSATRKLHRATRCCLSFMLVFMFTDSGYAAALNSFYSQTPSLVFLLISAGFAARLIAQEGRSVWDWVGLAAAAMLYLSSKPQEAVTGPFFALILGLAAWAWGSRWRKNLGLVCALGLLGFAFWYYRQTPEFAIRKAALYNTVFYELLPNSPDPRADLAALGLDPDLVRYNNTYAFTPEAAIYLPWFEGAFYDKISLRHVLQFYLTHPSRCWRLLQKGAETAFTLRVDYLGYVEKWEGSEWKERADHFGRWSAFKKRLLPGSPWTLLVFFGGNLSAAVFLSLRKGVSLKWRLGCASFGALNLTALTAFFTCTFGDSLFDLPRHLFTFNAMTDLCLIVVLVWLTEAVVRTFQARYPSMKLAVPGFRLSAVIGGADD